MGELRQTVRGLFKSPALTIVAVLTLGLGIGVTVSAFSIVDGVLLKSLPYPRADRLISLNWMRDRDRKDVRAAGNTSPLAAVEAWSRAPAIEQLQAYVYNTPVLADAQGAERVFTASVRAGFFTMLGASPAHGRLPRPDEDHTGAPPVAILSHAWWVSHMGGDSTAIGKTLTLDSTAYEIVGIMAPRFSFPARAEVWVNLGSALTGPDGSALARRASFWAVARLRPGMTLERAIPELDQVSRAAWTPEFTGWLPTAAWLRDSYVRDAREPLVLVFGAACLVLLVACANVAAMLMARALARQPDMAIRVVMGANRGRLVGQVLLESVLLALGGGILGVLLTTWAVPGVVALAGKAIPETAQVSIDGRLLAGAIILALLAGLLSGIMPASRALRMLPATSLRGRHGGVTASGQRVRTGEAFCVVQIALTLMLLVCAGLLGRSFLRLVHVDQGYSPEHVAFADLRLPKSFTNERRVAWEREVLDRVRALPGVEMAAVSNSVPLSGAEFRTVTPPGAAPGVAGPSWWIAAVSEDYLRVFTIPVQRGAWFSASPGPFDVVISEGAARSYFGAADPIGHDVTFDGHTTYTVVGVVGDTRQYAPGSSPPPMLYKAFANEPTGYMKVSVRTVGDPAALIEPLRRVLLAIGPTIPIDHVRSMTTMISTSIASTELYVWLLGAFAAIALVMAATGIYGVVSHAVARRTHEIGVRMALGAERGAVQSLIVGRGAALLAVGLGIGLAGTFATTRLLRKFLFQVSPMDPAAVTVVAALLAATVLLASYIPARRAAKVDPMVALRQE